MSLVDKLSTAISPVSIDSFKSTIGRRGGLAPQNRFAIFMTPPSATFLNLDVQAAASSLLSGNFGLSSLVNDPRDLNILCESVSLPGRQIQTLDYQDLNFRNTVKQPTGYFNEDVTFTFHLTNDYHVKKLFDKWIDTIINPKTYNTAYKNQYVTDVTIQQLNQKNIPVYGIKLKNAFPVTINTLELNNASGDTQKVSITITYDDYEPEGAITSALSGVKNIIGGVTKLI